MTLADVKTKKPYKLTLSKLAFLSSVDSPAQGEGGAALLLKRNSDEFEMRAKVIKTSDELGLVFGYAFASSLDGGETPHVDVQNDAIDADFLKTAMEFMEAGAPTDVNHDFEADGKIVFAWPLVPDVNEALGIKSDVIGLAVAVKPSKDTYAKFKSGELTGFSIAGTGIREPLEKRGPTAVEKRAALTTAELGHTHLIHGLDDSMAGTTSHESTYVDGQPRDYYTGHCHPWVRNEDGSITVGEAMGHTHGVGAMSASLAKSLASKSTRSSGVHHAATTTEGTMPTEHELKIADLEKQVARLSKIAKLSGAHKAHFDTLGSDDAEAFLTKSAAERDALVAEVAKRNEEGDKVVYISKSTGDVYKAKDDPRMVDMAKRMDAQAEAIEKADVRKRATEALGKLAGGDDVHDLIVRSVLKSGATQEQIDAALTAMKGWNALAEKASVAKGVNPGSDPQPGSSDVTLAAFEKGLVAFAKANNIPNVWTDARAAFVQTEEGAALKRAYDESLNAG